MSVTLEDSHLKLARLYRAFTSDKLDLKLIENILKTVGDINYRLSSSKKYAGYTALHFIKFQQDLNVLQLLLKYGADFTIKNDKEQTILHEALDKYTDELSARWGLNSKLSDEIIREVLSAHVANSVSENPSNKYGLTHFHAACMTGHMAAVKMFLKNGVPVDLIVNDDSPIFPGCTPLVIAVKSCALEVVKILLKYNAGDSDGVHVMHWLIEYNRKIVDFCRTEGEAGLSTEAWFRLRENQQIIYLLLKSNKISTYTSTDEVGLSSLHIACTTGSVVAVEKLLTDVIEIDQPVNAVSPLWPGFTALHFAAYFDLNTVKLLLSKSASLMTENTNGSTPFDICLERYALKDILSIMSTQPMWTEITLSDGQTKLLNLVATMQDIQKFRSFLDKHTDDLLCVDENSPLWPGYTPLHLAVLFSEQTKNRSNYTFHVSKGSSWNQAEMIFQPSLILVEECLKRQFDVTRGNHFDCTPLHVAFRYQKTLTVKKLLQRHKQKVNPVNRDNLSHLHIACASGDENIVKKLLLLPDTQLDLPLLSEFTFYREKAAGKTVMERLPAGSTPLHAAVAGRHCKVVKLLVDNGADVNATDVCGVTPIHRLLTGWSLDTEDKISKILLSSSNLREVTADYTAISHLHVASFFNNVDAVKRILAIEATIDTPLGSESALNDFCIYYTGRKCTSIKCEDTALHHAIRRKSRQVVNFLLHCGANVLTKKSDGEYPLYSVIISEDSGACLDIFAQFLLKNNAETKRVESYCGLTALHLASYIPDPVLVEQLIRRGVNVNAQLNENAIYPVGYTALHMLVNCCCSMGTLYEDFRRKFLEVTQMLLVADCDVTLCNAKGNTPIHMLYNHYSRKEKLHKNLLKMMINGIKNFHTNPADELGVSLFHIACFQNNTTIAKKFLKCGVNVNAAIDLFHRREAANSALQLLIQGRHWNSKSPKLETIDALLEHGVDVNAQNIDGDSVLHKIISFELFSVDIFPKFIRPEADFNKPNQRGVTPFTKLLLLREVNKLKAIKLLVEHGCCINQFTSDAKGWLAKFLYDSSYHERAAIFETLFKSCRINESDTTGRSAIHNIVSATRLGVLSSVTVKEYSKLITTLCDKGCNIDSQDRFGRTALHLAVLFINPEAVSALLLNGADINIVDMFNMTVFAYFLNPDFQFNRLINGYWYEKLIESLYLHVKKLQYLKLDVNKNDFDKTRDVSLKLDLTYKMQNFHSEINDMQAFVLGEGSNSFGLKDVLLETGIINVYPFNQYVRTVLDTYLKNIDVHLRDYTEIIGIVKLQIRKAMKRKELISSLLFMRSQLMKSSTQSCLVSNLPDICYHNVLSYLSNSDLVKLILATDLLKLPSDTKDEMPVDMKKSLIEIAGSYNPNVPKRIKLDLSENFNDCSCRNTY